MSHIHGAYRTRFAPRLRPRMGAAVESTAKEVIDCVGLAYRTVLANSPRRNASPRPIALAGGERGLLLNPRLARTSIPPRTSRLRACRHNFRATLDSIPRGRSNHLTILQRERALHIVRRDLLKWQITRHSAI